MEAIVNALVGGVLIGLAASFLLWSHGRIAGISGILAGVVGEDRDWRVAFLAGLLGGGLLVQWLSPESFGVAPGRTLPMLALAGVLVGYGTRLGSGCTSGHGICGISRMSVRSLVATPAFLSVGIVVATLVGLVMGGAA